MCCKDITDVYQLLKASGICKEDFGSYDILDVDNTKNNDYKQYLIFKKWHDIHPGTEFRCFVRNKCIIGISPRDWPQYHEYVCAQKLNIVNDIVTLFKEHIKPKFPLYDCKLSRYLS